VSNKAYTDIENMGLRLLLLLSTNVLRFEFCVTLHQLTLVF